MEVGLIFALLAGVGFAASSIFVRRGVYQSGESFTGVLISAFIATLFFAVLLFFTAEWDKLWSISWRVFILLGVAGITHFVAGRFLFYGCVRLIGANKASAISRTTSLYAVTFGVLFLKEALTTFLVLGVLCIISGTVLVSVGKEGVFSKVRGKGVLFGLGSAFFWGTSGVLIKPAVQEIGSPFAAAFMSYIVASIIMAGLLLRKGQRKQLTELRRISFIPLVIAGVFGSIAHLFRFVALGLSPVSLVEPLFGISVLVVLVLSFLINRNIEVFTWRVISGMVVTVIGTVLLFQ